MAIFYEHIKGCNPNNSFTSWIEWSKETESPAASILDAKYLPNIYVGKEDKTNSLGKIITSDATEQSINKPFKFAGNVNFANQVNFKNQVDFSNQVIFYKNIFFEYAQNEKIQLSTGSQGELEVSNINQLKISITNTNFIKFTTEYFETQTIKATTKLTAQEIEVLGKCQAQYFNATSDARAKSNITPAHFSALDVVNQLPIYKFQYLNTQEPVIGLIAQEAADYNLDGFNMVDNLTASGEDGDYMKIKESKLVYVLWKAVQELSAEVESLKAQLNNK